MARIRTIKPEFFIHYDLYQAEIKEKLPLRIAFAALWTQADKEGRFKWRPEELKAGCLPHDKVDFSRVLNALLTRGFISLYTVNGCDYGWIPSWSKHQVINNRERESELPSPNECNNIDACPTRGDACPTESQDCKEEGKGKERKGKEGERRVVDAWNATLGVKRIIKLTAKRTQHLKARLSETYWPWEEALKKFPLQCTTGGGWIPDFDFFVRPDTVVRILEGKYDFTPKGNLAPIKRDTTDTIGSAPDELIRTPEEARAIRKQLGIIDPYEEEIA